MTVTPQSGYVLLRLSKQDITRTSGLILPQEISIWTAVHPSDTNIPWDAVVLSSFKDAVKYETDGNQFVVVPVTSIVAILT